MSVRAPVGDNKINRDMQIGESHMSIEIKQIFLTKPNRNNDYSSYENQLQTRSIFGNHELEELFKKNKDKIMERVENEIEDYVNCDDLCNDEEDMFPQRCMLTGEWYISEINFEDVNFLRICTSFIGTDLGYKDDYLGLEVVFYYDADSKVFRFDGVNSESL